VKPCDKEDDGTKPCKGVILFLIAHALDLHISPLQGLG